MGTLADLQGPGSTAALRQEAPLRAARTQGTDAVRGLLVRRVMPGTLAEKLGIQADDVILAINDAEIATPDDVRDALEKIEAGDKVTLRAHRPGEGTITLEAERPNPRRLRRSL